MSLRQKKVSSLIKELAAEFLQTESLKGSMVTVTRADVSKDLAHSNIYISVYPTKKEEGALKSAKKKRSDFREFFKSQAEIKTVPMFDFVIDEGEKNRQRIDELSNSS